MAQKVNLDKLKSEIDSRKQEITPTGSGAAPRDVFLHGLLESLNHGHETPSSSLIKTVDNQASKLKGEKAKLPIAETTPVAQPVQPKVEMSPERDHKLFEDMETMRKKTLSESMSAAMGTAPTAAVPPTVNYGGQQMLTSLPPTATPGIPVSGVQLNEAALVESVRQIVNTHLVENFAPILEDAIKNTVIEMYAEERIEKVIKENSKLIEQVVYATIRKLQNKKKPQ